MAVNFGGLSSLQLLLNKRYEITKQYSWLSGFCGTLQANLEGKTK